MKVALSIGVQRMVRSDLGGSGVMFSIDTETGFDKVVVDQRRLGPGRERRAGRRRSRRISGVQAAAGGRRARGRSSRRSCGDKAQKMIYAPDGEQPDQERADLEGRARGLRARGRGDPARSAAGPCAIEEHYGCPMDMEWAKDGETGEMFIVQARPETVQSRRDAGRIPSYRDQRKGGKLVTGLASATRSSPAASA